MPRDGFDPLTLDELDKLTDGPVGALFSHGYLWFRDAFLPAVSTLEAESTPDIGLLICCYFCIGDIHSINNAPKAALHSYQKALKLDPDNEDAHREIAECAFDLGNEPMPRHHVKQAIRLAPHDSSLHEASELYKDTEYYAPDARFFQEGDPVWAAHEHLANLSPERGLSVLESFTSDQADRARLRCLGALQDTDGYIKVLSAALAGTRKWEFEQADWFYLPHGLIDEAVLWETFLSSDRDFSGIFFFPDEHDPSDTRSVSEQIREIMRVFQSKAQNSPN